MDTSKEYIKMCKEAKEIQKRDIPKYSFVAVKPCWATSDYGRRTWNILGITTASRKQHNPYGVFVLGNPHSGIKRKDLIWLPRQDQLQDMIGGDAWGILYCFITYTKQIYTHERRDSMEQLWLAFVMKEKYNKTWRNERWFK